MSSILQYPAADNPSELQVWNNAAFDNGESEDSMGIKSSSWWTQSLESSCSKENVSPVTSFKSSSVSSLPIINNPLNSNTILVNSQENNNNTNHNKNKNKNPMKIVLKQGGGLVSKNVNQEEEKEERKIDKEIQEIEKEISRLSSRLEALRLEKAERSLKTCIEKRGRIVPAKFMEPKQTVKIEEPPKINRRGVSLGPSEIYSATKARLLLSKQEMMTTPVSTTKNRRKSCFWKLEEIDELKAAKERGKSFSVSPRSRKNVSKIQAPKMAATTICSRKSVKKEDGLLGLVQPKTLFRDGEKDKSVGNNKKPVKPPGRVVASRYNQTATNGTNEVRKRSLPDSDKEDANKRRASQEIGVNQRIESSSSKMKKKWEIPSELVVFKSDDAATVEKSSLIPNSLKADVLPKIRTFRCVNETPRDSGAAKRVADLVGKKSFFSIDQGEEISGEDSVCQALRFDFEEEEYV